MRPWLVSIVFVTSLIYGHYNVTYSEVSAVKVLSEKTLIRDLLKRYNTEGKVGRPVVHPSDKVLVNFSLSLIQIVDLDEKNQILKTNIWYHYRWSDCLLKWRPADHDNITSVRVPSDKIWLPDIVLYNFADNRLSEQRDALVVVGHTGELLWMPQAILNSSCSFDTLFFPFDEQICHLKFGSWSYNGAMLDIDFIGDVRQMDLNDYIESNEWDITLNTAVKNFKYYTCCPEPYTDMTFTGVLLLQYDRDHNVYGSGMHRGQHVLQRCTNQQGSTVAQIVQVVHSAAKLLCVHEVIEAIISSGSNPSLRGRHGLHTSPSEISHSDPETLVARTHLLKCQPGYRQYVPDYGALQEITSEVCEPSTSAALPTLPSSSSVSQYDGSSLLDELKSVREMLEDDMAEVDSAELLKKHVREWHMIACVLDKLFFVLYLAVLVLGLGAMMLQSYLL
ncbi:Neuronal acetylcholine receptor subunit alpha-2 [Bulinus truncatus]|nr:Neuronal acetylcholine receptor subunit alpha-2 [Bulinus truncatus]